MLILTRSRGEEIVIGDTIKIKIVDVRSGGRVRVGIDAPTEIPVHRGEVKADIDQNGEDRLRPVEPTTLESMIEQRKTLTQIIEDRDAMICDLRNKVLHLTTLAEKWQRHEMAAMASAQEL